jgi:hypothetical protein
LLKRTIAGMSSSAAKRMFMKFQEQFFRLRPDS